MFKLSSATHSRPLKRAVEDLYKNSIPNQDWWDKDSFIKFFEKTYNVQMVEHNQVGSGHYVYEAIFNTEEECVMFVLKWS